MNTLFELTEGLEAFSFQHNDDKFVDELTKICTSMLSKGERKLSVAAYRKDTKELTELLFKRFGVNFRFNIGLGALAAVIPGHIPVDSGLFGIPVESFEEQMDYDWDKFSKNMSNTAEKTMEVLERNGFTVDLDKARVEGYPKSIVIDMFLDPDLLYKHFGDNPRIMAGVVLHEVGHQMTTLAYMSDTIACNRVLSELSLSKNKDSVRKYKVRLRELLPDNEKAGFDKQVKEADTALVLSTASYAYFSSRLSNLTDKWYHQNSSEQVADSFASKFGFGYELAEGLAKVGIENGMYRWVKDSISMFFSILTTMLILTAVLIIITSPVINLSILTGGIIFAISATIATAIVVWFTTSDGNGPSTYDRIIKRVDRLKREMIMMIKDYPNKKNAKYMKEAIRKIDRMEAWVRSTKFYTENMWDFIAYLISPTNKQEYREMKLSDFMEELANNTLYARYIELELLASGK